MKIVCGLILSFFISIYVITSLPAVKSYFFKARHPEYVQIKKFEMTAIGAGCYKQSRKAFYRKVLVDMEFNYNFENKKIYKIKNDFFNTYKFIYLESCDNLKIKTVENLTSMTKNHQIELWVNPKNLDQYKFLKIQSTPDLRTSIFGIIVYFSLNIIFSPLILLIILPFFHVGASEKEQN